MLASSLPTKFNIPFANNAVLTNTNVIPQASQIGITTGAASLVDGFPPVTFIPVGAGGTPPWGRDFNGLFNQISAWTRFADCAGGLPLFDSSFSSAIGGYPQGAVIAAVSGVTAGSPQGGTHLWLSTADNNTVNPDVTFNTANWVPVPAVIDSAVTFTVHGGGQFSDLNAAFDYLRKFLITRNGSVVLQLAGASSGTATQYTYTVPIVCDHPNNDRISIYGASMLGTVPISISQLAINGFSSGTRASDLVTNLATLRSKFATEIFITGANASASGAAFTVRGKSLAALDALLLTSDGQPSSVGFSFLCNGGTTLQTHNSGLAAANFSYSGVTINFRSCLALEASVANTASIICCGCGVVGFSLENGAEFTSNSPILSIGNAGSGILCNPGSNAQFDSILQVACNSSHGIQTLEGSFYSSVSFGYIAAWRNGGYGISCVSSPPCIFPADFGGGVNVNALGSAAASAGSNILITGAFNIGTCTPALNTFGNGGAFIVN